MKPKWLVVGIVGLILLAFSSTDAQEATPDLAESEGSYALEWPVELPSEEDIAEARACDLDNLPAQRYPERIELDELAEAYSPEAACDWAMLAIAYTNRIEGGAELPEAGIGAFVQAVTDNPALAFSSPMFFGYYNGVEIVEPPPFSEQALKEVVIDYAWGGMGEQVRYRAVISREEDEFVLSGVMTTGPDFSSSTDGTATPTGNETHLSGSVDAELVQALGPALRDLLPIGTPFSMEPCWDNYPDWTVSLTFADGMKVELITNHSNVIGVGGPWQTTIQGQSYMQYSSAFVVALLDITNELELPLGEPMAWGCGGEYDLLDLAFSAETS